MHNEYKVVNAKELTPPDLEKALNAYAKDGWRINHVLPQSERILLDRLAGSPGGHDL